MEQQIQHYFKVGSVNDGGKLHLFIKINGTFYPACYPTPVNENIANSLRYPRSGENNIKLITCYRCIKYAKENKFVS